MNTQIQEVTGAVTTANALKMAKKELNHQKYGIGASELSFDDVIKAIDEALEAEQVCQAQEASEQAPCEQPVAWMRKIDNVIQRITLNKIQINDIPLYTHLAQPWQGLTDDEIARLVLINEVDKSGDTGFARLIEQALRERNT
jgi:hypothetical protein